MLCRDAADDPGPTKGRHHRECNCIAGLGVQHILVVRIGRQRREPGGGGGGSREAFDAVRSLQPAHNQRRGSVRGVVNEAGPKPTETNVPIVGVYSPRRRVACDREKDNIRRLKDVQEARSGECQRRVRIGTCLR